jgi:hypothetical protein
VTTTLASASVGRLDAALLRGYLDRLITWDRRALVRVVATPGALNVYGSPSSGVLTQLEMSTAIVGPEGIDHIASAKMLRQAVGRDAQTVPLDLALVPLAAGGHTLAHLPPANGWQLPIHAVAGDLLPLLDAAAAEYRRRGAPLGSLEQQQLSDEIWGEIAWAGLPLRVLHLARLLGFLGPNSSRVTAATCGPWKRFTAMRGRVYTRTRGLHPGLHLVR